MDIISEVKALNSKAAELNEARKKALWEKNRAEEELKTALVEYNKKYGTSLTADDISSEFSKVEAEIKAQAEKVKAEIEAIERGEEIVNSTDSGNATVAAVAGVAEVEASEKTVDTVVSSDVPKTSVVPDSTSKSVFDTAKPDDWFSDLIGGTTSTEEKSIDDVIASSESVKTEPVKTEPVKTEPTKVEPAPVQKPATTVSGFDFSKYI